jgi:pimeloyl-ACP methyl ester carboxylesterase
MTLIVAVAVVGTLGGPQPRGRGIAMLPATQYANSGGHSIAYQVIGDGPVDLLMVQGLLSHLDLQWCDPLFANFLHQVASFSRLIVMDQRGVGLSDPCVAIPSIDERVADLHAVVAAVGIEKMYLVGHCHGGPPATVYAATYPERLEGLVLMSTFARGIPDPADGDPDRLCALSGVDYAEWMETIDHWGEGRSLRYFNPSRGEGWVFRKLFATFERAALSKGMARAAVASTLQIDVTPAARAIRVPTLVMHCSDDFMSVASARHLAGIIPSARFVELAGADHAPFMGAGSNDVLAHIRDFISDRHPLKPGAVERFGAVLITDIVDSTKAANALGDERWAETLIRHDLDVRQDIARHRGECLKFTGDGYLATFEVCEDALRCAAALSDTAARFDLAIRAGVHAGPYQPAGQDALGLTVIIASRLMSATRAASLLVSESVSNAVAGAGFRFGPARQYTLKGVTQPVVAAELVVSNSPQSYTHRWLPDTSEDQARATRLFDRVIIAGARHFPRAAHLFARASRKGGDAGRLSPRRPRTFTADAEDHRTAYATSAAQTHGIVGDTVTDNTVRHDENLPPNTCG